MESDTTSDLDALEGMMFVAREDADIVLASHHEAASWPTSRATAASFQGRLLGDPPRRRAGREHGLLFFRVYRASILREGYEEHGDALIRERGFACKAELLIKLSRLGASVAEVPVTLDWANRQGESKMRVLPTMAGYARMMTRQVASSRGSA